MTASSDKFVATAENFMQEVVEASATLPVMVDFWASWCGPCKQLMPLLDRLADEFRGRLRLAKVNTDEQPELAQQMGIRSLPTVALFKDRQVVDHFMGVVPEAQIRKMLEPHLPAVPESPVEKARKLIGASDLASAHQVLDQALARDKDNVELKATLGELLAASGNLEAAREELTALQAHEPTHPAVKRLEAVLTFQDVIAAHPDVSRLREDARSNPHNLELVHALAVHELLEGNYAAALERWLEIMRKNRSFGEDLARKSLVMAFSLIGDTDPLVSETRRKMTRLLF